MTIFKRQLGRIIQNRLFLLATLLMLGPGMPGLAKLQAAEFKPFATVALNSVDNILADVNFIGSLVGQPQMADQIKPMLNGFTQGLDKSKPIGVMVEMGGMGPGGALCIPVTNFKQLTQNLMMFGVTAEEKDGLFEISAQGQKVFAKEANGWATIAMMPEMLANLPDDPGQILGELTNTYDLGIQLNVQNIPVPFREMAMQQLQAGMEAGSQQKSDESDEEFKTRKDVAQAQIDQLKRFINELDEVTFGLALDGAKQRAFLDIAYTAIPGSQLAEQISINSDPKTNYAGFFQPDAAMMLTFSSKMAETDAANLQQMFEAARKSIMSEMEEKAAEASEEDREKMKSAADDFLQAFLSTLQEGLLDGGAVLNLATNSATFVAGGHIADPGKVESGLKKLSEVASKEDDFPGFQWNSESHADVTFHTMSVPVPQDKEEAQQLFGDSMDVVVGIGKKSVFFGFGKECLQAIKDVIDSSAASPDKSVAPMEMTIALQQILEVAGAMAQPEEKANIEMIAQMLANSSDGSDHVRIVGQLIPNGMRTRIELEEGVLRAIGMGVMQSRMQATGAPAGF